MNSAQVGVLKQSDQVRLTGLLNVVQEKQVILLIRAGSQLIKSATTKLVLPAELRWLHSEIADLS